MIPALLLCFALGALAPLAGGRAGRALGLGLVLAGCALSGVLAGLGLSQSAPTLWEPGLRLPAAELRFGVDALSAWFLAPLGAVGAMCALYGWSYRDEAGRAPSLAPYSLLLLGMAGVLLARDGVLLLLFWELMSLAGWWAMGPHAADEEVRRAGWVYLVLGQLGALALAPVALAGLDSPLSGPLLVLALIGFGAKMGLVPLHVWLPGAHAAAPSHVSALMSAVLVKMGVYGLLRVLLRAGGPPLWMADGLLALGGVGALLGVLLAIGQRDIKRVLAYSTVENLGIVAVGMGLGARGLALGDSRLAALGLGAALVHVWNHAAMKGLMFLGAGAVAHGAGTRDIERLGGLAKTMPRTAALWTLGAVALAGLPPLNGFVGEWMLFSGLLSAHHPALSGLLGILALVGGLAALAFARLVGLTLLGAPRSAHTGHEAPAGLVLPMGALALTCVALGFGGAGVPEAAAIVAGPLPLDPAPLRGVSGAIWGGVGLVWALQAALLRRRVVRRAETWGCGYTAPDARMQYTGRSFAELIESNVVPEALRPRGEHPVADALFPAPRVHDTDYEDPLLRSTLQPAARRWALRLAKLRPGRGTTWQYVASIGAACVLALAWSALRGAP